MPPLLHPTEVDSVTELLAIMVGHVANEEDAHVVLYRNELGIVDARFLGQLLAFLRYVDLDRLKAKGWLSFQRTRFGMSGMLIDDAMSVWLYACLLACLATVGEDWPEYIVRNHSRGGYTHTHRERGRE